MNLIDIVKDNTVRFVRDSQRQADLRENVPAQGERTGPAPIDGRSDAPRAIKNALLFMRIRQRTSNENIVDRSVTDHSDR